MKTKINLIFLFGFVSVFLILQPLFLLAELIEPSRTVEAQQKPLGLLSVFSEPPELDVFLDGINIGKTPVISKQVKPGTHVLRVKETEKEIIILPEKSLQMSLFKNSLIEIPEKKAKSPAPAKPEAQPMTPEKKTKDSRENKGKYDPFYWPTNPSGPIK